KMALRSTGSARNGLLVLTSMCSNEAPEVTVNATPSILRTWSTIAALGWTCTRFTSLLRSAAICAAGSASIRKTTLSRRGLVLPQKRWLGVRVIEMSFWYAEIWYAQPEKLIWLVLNPSHARFRPAAVSSLPYLVAT